MVGSGLNSVGSQKLLAAAHAAGHLDLHGLFREAELGGDRLLRHATEFAEDEDFTTTGGQGIDGGGEQNDFVAFAGGLSGTRPSIIYDGQGGQICYVVDGGNLFSPRRVDHQVPRHLEQKSFRVADRLTHADPPQPEKRLLHHIVDIRRERKLAAQIRPQRRFVHLYLLGEPAVLVGVRQELGRRRIQGRVGQNCVEAVAAGAG